MSDDSKSDKKAPPKETAQYSTSNSTLPSLTCNSKDKSPLASKKILSEKSAAKKDARKEKTDSEKQKQLKNFDFDDEDEEPVVKPTGKKPVSVKSCYDRCVRCGMIHREVISILKKRNGRIS